MSSHEYPLIAGPNLDPPWQKWWGATAYCVSNIIHHLRYFFFSSFPNHQHWGFMNISYERTMHRFRVTRITRMQIKVTDDDVTMVIFGHIACGRMIEELNKHSCITLIHLLGPQENDNETWSYIVNKQTSESKWAGKVLRHLYMTCMHRCTQLKTN